MVGDHNTAVRNQMDGGEACKWRGLMLLDRRNSERMPAFGQNHGS